MSSNRASACDGWSFCRAILPAVSRSFALIIPRCPEPIDRGLCVAYLICRIADTIEDEPGLTSEQRDRLYDAFLAVVASPDDEPCRLAFLDAWPTVPAGDYGRLVAGVGSVMAAFRHLPTELVEPIRTCVQEMVAGMRTVRAVEVRAGVTYYCRDLADLDRYCHHVAGVVGIMSTRLFLTRLGGAGFPASPDWIEDGRRLGLGLQMTNIIKDCRVDAERGVSYIPACFCDPEVAVDRLTAAGRATLIGHAIGHLEAGWRYVARVPATEKGIRAFLLGSLLPAVATLALAASGTHEHPTIPRAEMSAILDFIARCGGDNDAVDAWFRRRCRPTLLPSPVARR